MATLDDLRAHLSTLTDVHHVGTFQRMKDVPGGTPPHSIWKCEVIFKDAGDHTQTIVFRADVFDHGEAGEAAFWQGSTPAGVPEKPFDVKLRNKVANAVKLGQQNPRTNRVIRGAKILSLDGELETAMVETLEETGVGNPSQLAKATFFVGLDGGGNLDIREIP